jgi:hypothetical protein
MSAAEIADAMESEQLAFVWKSASGLYFLWHGNDGGIEQSGFSAVGTASHGLEHGLRKIETRMRDDSCPCALVLLTEELRRKNVRGGDNPTLPAPFTELAVTAVPPELRRVAREHETAHSHD